MKDIINKILESKKDLCPETQNEFETDYAYQSYAIPTTKKFKYGFLTFNADGEFYSVTTFNKDSEYAETFAEEYGLDCEELFNLKVGETIEDYSHGSQYAFVIIRIW